MGRFYTDNIDVKNLPGNPPMALKQRHESSTRAGPLTILAAALAFCLQM